MKNLSVKLFLFVIICLLFINEVVSQSLLVTPTRIVFEGNKRTQEISLHNTASKQVNYEVLFINYLMSEDGSFIEVTDEEAYMIAEPYLRFFPKRISLGPNETQTLRIQLRKPSNLEEGEYRSHLYFRNIPDRSPAGLDENDTTAYGLKLIPVFGITFPVIFRHGDQLNVNTYINEAALRIEDNENVFIDLEFNREGNMSAYGDITILHKTQDNFSILKYMKGIAIYTPNNARYMKILLENIHPQSLTEGEIIIRYNYSSDNKNASYTAEYVLSLTE